MNAAYFEKWFWHKRIGIGPLSVDDARSRHENNRAYVALVEHQPSVLFRLSPGWVSVVLMDVNGRPACEVDLIDEQGTLRLKSAKRRVFGDAIPDPIQFTMINLNESGHIIGAEGLDPSEVYKAYAAAGSALKRPSFGEFGAVLERVTICAVAMEKEAVQDGQFLQAVANSSVCADYYRLCAAHPMRSGKPPAGLGSKDIQRSASGRVLLNKMPGAGHGYEVGGLPANVSLALVIQGRTSIEADFSVPFGTAAKVGTIASLCHQALLYAGQAPRNPPYPRPEFSSPEEFVEIAMRLQAFVIALAKVAQRGAE